MTQRFLHVFSARFFNRFHNLSQRFLHDHLFAKWAPGNVFCTFSKRFFVYTFSTTTASLPRAPGYVFYTFSINVVLSFSRTTPSFSTRFLKRFLFVFSRENYKKTVGHVLRENYKKNLPGRFLVPLRQFR